MAITKCRCPHCSQVIRTKQPLPARVGCPRCGTCFTYPEEDEAPPNRGPLLAGILLGGFLFLALGVGLAVYCFTALKKSPPVTEPSIEEAATSPALPAPPITRRPLLPPLPPPGPVGEGPPQPEPVSPLSESEQARVKLAIDRGIAFLKQSLNGETSRRDHYSRRLGAVALAGLTLLNCDVPANDPSVVQVTNRVRSEAPKLIQTYDLALCLLFLDRLGEEQDRDLIQSLALKLVAGQNAAGGWNYTCPSYPEADYQQLLTLLRKLSPEEDPARNGGGNPNGVQGITKSPGEPSQGISKTPSDSAQGITETPRPDHDKLLPPPEVPPASPAPEALPELDPALRNLPVLEYQPGQPLARERGQDDNSNTQFALLAVWAARKYGLPVSRTLALVDARFRSSQAQDGSWSYRRGSKGHWEDSMTCAGLLGLAVGRAAGKQGDVPQDVTRDPAISQGLDYLGKIIGRPPPGDLGLDRPSGWPRLNCRGPLYFFWSLERVGVVYDLRQIDGQDWYLWGEPIIVGNQQADGSWSAVFPGIVDTCFALLFLKRVNVVKDLTSQLKLLSKPREPEPGATAPTPEPEGGKHLIPEGQGQPLPGTRREP
jgi:hypothetical protein